MRMFEDEKKMLLVGSQGHFSLDSFEYSYMMYIYTYGGIVEVGYLEETNELMLDFNKIASMTGQKVIPVAVQNAKTNEVILVAYTNEQAFLESIKQRRLVLWSTSRNELWEKGKTSGNGFILEEIFVNCEQNSLVYKVTPENGNICHTSYNGVANNCYYRKLDMDTMELINLNKIRYK